MVQIYYSIIALEQLYYKVKKQNAESTNNRIQKDKQPREVQGSSGLSTKLKSSVTCSLQHHSDGTKAKTIWIPSG